MEEVGELLDWTVAQMTVEDELRRMGIPEEKVAAVAKNVRDSAVTSTCSIDGILNGLRMLIQMEKTKALTLDLDRLANYSAGLLKK